MSDTVQFVLHGDRVRTQRLSVARESTALRTDAFHSKFRIEPIDARLALRLHGSRAVSGRAPVDLSKVLKLNRWRSEGIRVPGGRNGSELVDVREEMDPRDLRGGWTCIV